MAQEQQPGSDLSAEASQAPAEDAAHEAPPTPASSESLAEQSARLRAALVEQLKGRGLLHSPALEAALLRVPRECFLPDLAEREGLERIYSDEAIITKRSSQGAPISSSSAPSMMAIMLEQLALSPGLRVLEIGAGTGYNAALLAEMVGDPEAVVTIDIDQDVVDQARQNLANAGYPEVIVLCADGVQGAPDLAPFDRIELTVATDDIAPAWREQLAVGGRLVLPLELHRHQRGQVSLALVKHADYLESVAAAYAFFIPLRGGQAMPSEHTAPLGVMTAQDGGHHWELNVYGAPLAISADVCRDVLHLLSGPYKTQSLHQRGSMRELVAYLELRYGEEEAIYVWSGQPHWGFEGWATGVLSHPARAQQAGPAFPPLPARFSHEPGVALLRPATPSADDAGLDKALLFGSASALRRLQAVLQEWEKLNRPDLSALSVRAYPPGAAPAPGTGEWQIAKRSVHLLLSFARKLAGG